MLLSDRMRAVVGLVKPCDCMADIGCDHGYVAMELVQTRVCKKMIAMDINVGPLEIAKVHIKDYDLQDYIETRLSDGANALQKGEADGFICAGMGGKLIIHILSDAAEIIRDMQQIILQPQSEIDEVRKYLRENGFEIEQEDMVCEDGKYYPMMRVVPHDFGKHEARLADQFEQGKHEEKLAVHFEQGKQQKNCKVIPEISEISKEEAEKMTRVSDNYGPCLLEMGHPVLHSYLLREKENLENIQGNLKCQKQPSARQQYRIMELEQELSDIVFCLYRYFK